MLLLHNPDRTGYESPAVWEAMAALRGDGLARAVGVAPGPANGFTLDLIACLERFGDVIDWAMVILNPLEPWPGELVLDAAAAADVSVITRVVDYGGLFWGDLAPDTPLHEHDHRRFRPDGWIERGLERIESMRPVMASAGLSPMGLACQWNLAHPAVACVAPTLIQEAGPDARPIEDKRTELASLPVELRLEPEHVAKIRELGDNTGSMKLKGASAEHEGEDAPDRWALSPELARDRRAPRDRARPRPRLRRLIPSARRRRCRASNRGRDRAGRAVARYCPPCPPRGSTERSQRSS